MRRALHIALITVAALLAVVVLAIVIVTGTRPGHEFVRKKALAILGSKAHGIVRIGGVSGNLLTGIVLTDVSIRDSSGTPLFAAERVSTRYDLWALAHRKVVLTNVALTRPLVVLDRPPGGQWNFKRIFPGDSTQPQDTTLGFGDWITFRDVSIAKGRLLVRTPWHPDSTLPAAAQDSAVRVALGGTSRANVIRVADGYQKVMDFREIDARFPLVRLADPDEPTKLFQAASLRMIALPFRPPAAEVRDMAGTFRMNGDSLWWSDVKARLPGSSVGGSGRFGLTSGDIVLRLHGAPVALADLRWLYPRLPSQGGGSLDFVMTLRGDTGDYVARNADVRVGGAQLRGDFGLMLAEGPRFHDTDLRFSGLGTKLLEQLVPNLDVPRAGTLGGRAAVAGTMAALRLDADVTFDDQRSGRSRVVAVGEVGIAGTPKVLSARNLRLRMEPLQVDLARIAMPTLPVGGVVTGTALLNGSTNTTLLASADLVHEEAGARSRLTGRGAVRLAGASTWLDLDLRADPVALATVGRFAPALGLRGTAAGPIRVRGTLGNLQVDSRLALPDGGSLFVVGTLDLASPQKGYDLAAQAYLFNVKTVMARAPATSLTMTASARGRGFDPKTRRAAFRADVEASSYDSVAVDSAHVRVAIADGMLNVTDTRLDGPHARVRLGGDFALTPARTGELTFRVDVDSLDAFARWLPRDTGAVAPRPAVVAEALRRAREDSARLAQATETERAMSGAPGPRLRVDTPQVVRKDVLAGSLAAGGTVRGNLAAFDVRGRLAAEHLVVSGNSVGRARAEFGWLGARTPSSTMILGAHLDQAIAAGFAMDSADVRLSYRAPTGSVELAIRQSDQREYTAKADFAFHPDHREIHLADLALRFDTTRWTSTRPSAIRWGQPGIEIETLELRNGATGRVYVNGRIPTRGEANLQVAITEFELGDLAALLETDTKLTGRLSFAATARGTTRDPAFGGAFGLVASTFGGKAIPDLHGTFRYADERLEARAFAARSGGAALATADATVPINLAIAGVTGPRFHRNRPLSADVLADSLPLDVLPSFTDAVSNVQGMAIGRVAVRGSMAHPAVAGGVAVRLGSFRIVPSGVTYHDIAGMIRLSGDTVILDSLVARAGGTVRVWGGLGIASLSAPSFDLHLEATSARLMDNERGRLTADAMLAAVGPFEGVRATGTVRVREGVIYIPESDNKHVIGTGDPAVYEAIDTSVTSNRELVPVQSPLLANLQADVRVTVDRDTWVRSKDANVEIYSDGDLAVRVDRRKQALVVEGFVDTDRGVYTFLSRRFNVTRGSATFIGSPDLNPTLQVTGEIDVPQANREALTIQVQIGGTLRNPRIQLESNANPPLSQSDLLSYLAFGRSSSSLLSFSGTSSLAGSSAGGGLEAAAAAFATRQLTGVALGVMVDQIEGQASRSFGLDQLDITPTDVPLEIWRTQNLSNFLTGTQVEAGKYTDKRTFVAIQAHPTFVFPGLRVQRQLGGGLRLETTIESRYKLMAPSLGQQNPGDPQRVVGAFLIREWRF